MDFIQVVTLALVQGLTEFLPVSSSAHLVLVPALTGWQDQGLAFDVAVHVGSLVAVCVYFRNEISAMAEQWIGSLKGKELTADARLAWAVLFGTIPVGVAGLLLNDQIEAYLRSPLVIATTTIGFGLLLGWADLKGRRDRGECTIHWKDVLVIGIAQALALVPGTSRSGITMTAGLAMGLTREAAARFSFLLSIPVIVLAGALATLELAQSPGAANWNVLFLGAALSALSAFTRIHFFLMLLDRVGMLPFVVYRLVLGIGLLMWFTPMNG
jgi:undecaprenyl-diphosphatase